MTYAPQTQVGRRPAVRRKPLNNIILLIAVIRDGIKRNAINSEVDSTMVFIWIRNCCSKADSEQAEDGTSTLSGVGTRIAAEPVAVGQTQALGPQGKACKLCRNSRCMSSDQTKLGCCWVGFMLSDPHRIPMGVAKRFAFLAAHVCLRVSSLLYFVQSAHLLGAICFNRLMLLGGKLFCMLP